MGILVRGEPAWAPRATVAFIALVTLLFYHGLPLLLQVWTPPTTVADPIVYLVAHPFTATNLIIAPLGALFFFFSAKYFHGSEHSVRTRSQEAEFFARMTQSSEVAAPAAGGDVQQERIIGQFLAALSALLGVLAFVGNSPLDTMALVGCALVPALLALVLLSRARTRANR